MFQELKNKIANNTRKGGLASTKYFDSLFKNISHQKSLDIKTKYFTGFLFIRN